MSASDELQSVRPTVVDFQRPGNAKRIDVEPGQRLGRYVTLDLLGAGGMGVVFAAYDPELDRRVALKLLSTKPDDNRRASEGQQRLLREARILARLTHPNIVTVHDVGLFEDRVFMAMEFVDGATLTKWLESQRTWREVVQTLVAAGRGLAAVHAEGLVHRDVKPDNIMVSEDGRVLLMDFGLVGGTEPALQSRASSLSRSGDAPLLSVSSDLGGGDSSRLTRPGARPGTALYMAPEQHLALDVDARSDQFAFCVSLYQALYGQHPFGGTTRASLVANVASGLIREPPADRHVPAHIRRAMRRGLATDPEDRWPSMDALLAELERDPSARRRRWIVASVAGLGVGAGVFGMYAMRDRQRQQCEDAAAALDAVWNDARRGEIEAAFLRSPVPYAADTWARIGSELDERFGAWGRQQTESCEATFVRGDQTQTRHEERLACLSERLGEMGALVAELAAPDAEVVEHAVEAVGDLTAIERCADPAYLTAPIEPPPDAQTEHTVAEMRTRLQTVEALHRTGRYARALEAARVLADEADVLGYRPLQAEVWFRVGSLEHELGAFEPARDGFERALFAARAGGDERLEARAAIQLEFVVGSSLADLRAARSFAGLAEATLQRLGPAPGLHSERAGALSCAYRYAGDYDEAIRYAEEALAHLEGAEDVPETVRAAALTDLANAHKGQGHYAEALAAQRQALEIRERTYGSQHPQVATSLNNIGNLLRRLGRPEEAEQLLERALRIRIGAYGEDHPEVASTLHNLANVMHALDRHEDALPYRRRVLRIREAVHGRNHPEVASALGTLANTLSRLGRHDEAVVHQRDALSRLRETYGSEHPAVATSLYNLGLTQKASGKVADALESYREAVAIYDATLGPAHRDLIDPCFAIGQALTDLERPREALEWLRRGITLADEHRASARKRAALRFSLAKALAETPGGRAPALATAHEALGMLEAEPEPPKMRDEIRAWVAERSASDR